MNTRLKLTRKVCNGLTEMKENRQKWTRKKMPNYKSNFLTIHKNYPYFRSKKKLFELIIVSRTKKKDKEDIES